MKLHEVKRNHMPLMELNINSFCVNEFLYEQINAKYPGREVHIDVSEDGENGAHIEYAKY